MAQFVEHLLVSAELKNVSEPSGIRVLSASIIMNHRARVPGFLDENLFLGIIVQPMYPSANTGLFVYLYIGTLTFLSDALVLSSMIGRCSSRCISVEKISHNHSVFSCFDYKTNQELSAPRRKR